MKKDHEKRVEGLQKEQETDKVKGQLIEMNLDLVSTFHLSISRPLFRPPDKSANLKIILLNVQYKHMLWVLRRTVFIRRFF